MIEKGRLHYGYNEVAGVYGDPAITFGYDLLDYSQASRNYDFYRVLATPGSTVLAEINIRAAGTFELTVESVPEPMTLSLLCLGGLGLIRRRRR